MKKKILIINNEKEYQKLLKKLLLYKSFLYHNTKFVSKSNYKNLNIIVTALNIKKRKERINYLYTSACNLCDESQKSINLCGFNNNKCYVQQKSNSNTCNGCCRKCLYQTPNGCSTKNLACKLFNCSEVKKRNKVLTYNDLDFLRILSLKNRTIVKSDYFSTKEDVLKDLYSYSFIYSTLRILYRLTKMKW